jgi:hypothetical protein
MVSTTPSIFPHPPTNSLFKLEGARHPRPYIKNASPAHSDSSVSLGTNWHVSPKKKWRRTKKTSAITVENQSKTRAKGKAKEQSTTGKGVASVRFETTSPFATPIVPRQTTSTPRLPSSAIRINLESARLDHIQAQESNRATYDIFAPQSSSSTEDQPAHDLGRTRSPLNLKGLQLYAPGKAGSSTAPGTQEWLKARVDLGNTGQLRDPHRQVHAASTFTPLKASSTRPVPSQVTNLLNPPKRERLITSPLAEGTDATLPNVSFTDPDYDRWARVGLRVALEEVVRCYGFPLDMVEKVYESKGSIEETARFLEHWKNYMEEALVAGSES